MGAMIIFSKLRQFLALIRWAYIETYKAQNFAIAHIEFTSKEEYIGKGFETLLKDFPNASVISDHFGKRDYINAEIRISNGTLTLRFKDLVCVEALYFSDNK